MPLPLANLKAITIEQAVAAPFYSSRLADAGAEVIKVKRPEGDFARGYDDVAAALSVGRSLVEPCLPPLV